MKQLTNYILCLCMTLLIATGTVRATISNTAPLPDSLLTEDYVYQYTFSDFPLACRIMERLRTTKKLPAHRLDITEGDLYFNNGYYHRALKCYQHALQSDSVRLRDDDYMDQLHRLISTYDCLHNDAKKAEYVQLLLDKAQSTGNRPMHSIALFNLGKMVYYQGDKPRGYEHMQQAVKEMQQTDYKHKFDNLRYDYNTLLVMQQWDKLYDEALLTLDALESVITREQGGVPHMQGLDNKELKALYAHRAVVLQRLGRTEEAERFYQKFLSLGHVHDRDNYLIMPYLSDRHRYDDIIRMNTARETFLKQQGDTVTYHMTTIKRSLGEAYEGKGNFRRAATYYKQLAVLRDSIKNREQRSAALELAAIYDTAEKEALVQQQASQLRERNIWLIAAAGTVFLLLLGLWIVIQHYRTIRRKNRAMAQSINEQMDYKKKLQESRKANAALHLQVEEMKKENPATEEVTEDTEEEDITEEEDTEALDLPPHRKEENDKIFERLEALLNEQPVYLDSNFSANNLVQLAGVNRNRLNSILTQCTGYTIAIYINNLRVEYAARRIREHPEYIISYIAQECGLPNVSTFHRLFRERYSMTPAEYKKAIYE